MNHKISIALLIHVSNQRPKRGEFSQLMIPAEGAIHIRRAAQEVNAKNNID